MAIDYQAVGASVTDLAFQNRVMGALTAQCIIVNAEAANTANHQQRLNLLARVIRDNPGYAREFAPVIASVAPLNALASLAASSDAQILTAVQAVWDAFALLNI